MLKRNAIVTFALAVFFWWAFMFAKHDPTLRPLIPFGDDPYDAVGSFGIIVGMLVALLALARAFWPYRIQPTAVQRMYLLRSEVAVVLTVLITLAGDGIALVRHPAIWGMPRPRRELLFLLGALAVAAAAALLLLRASREASPPGRWTPAIVTVSGVLVVLALYPERWIDVTITHLLTVVIGAILLFAPMRPLLTALVPSGKDVPPAQKRWGAVLSIGAAVGAFAFIGEMSEGTGHPPLRQLFLVASVFIGLSVAGLLVAYLFLGVPLGFARKPPSQEVGKTRPLATP